MTRQVSTPKSASSDSQYIFTLLRKCEHYRIPYDLMCRLNYTDLLALVVEHDIATVEEYLRRTKQQSGAKPGVEVREATPQMAYRFFGGKRNG